MRTSVTVSPLQRFALCSAPLHHAETRPLHRTETRPLQLTPSTETRPLQLTPSTELDRHDMSWSLSEALEHMDVNSSPRTPYRPDLMTGGPSDDLRTGVDVDDGYTAFDMNPRDPDDDFITDDTNTGPHSLGMPSPPDPASFDVDFDFPSVGFAPRFELSGAASPSLSALPPSHLLVDDEEESDYGLAGPLADLLDEAAVLDEMSLLDLALEEGFSREMAARLEEEGYLVPGPAGRNAGPYAAAAPDREGEDGGTSWSTMAQGNARTLRQGNQQTRLVAGIIV